MSKEMKDSKNDEQVKDSKNGGQNRGQSRNKRNNSTSKSGRRNNRNSKTGYKDTKGSNDLSWHVQSETLLRQSSDMSFAYSTGNPFKITYLDPAGSGVTSTDKELTLPGIATIEDCISFGDEFGKHNPMNYAANSLLQEMRSRIRPMNTYDAPDVAMIMGGAAEIYGMIAFAKRLLATANMYSMMNEYMPDALFKAQHIDPTSLKADPKRFCSRLNRLILNMNKVYVPNRMTLFQLITQKYSNYYIEGNDIKDQIYFWTPSLFRAYFYNQTTDYAGALEPCITFPYDGNRPYFNTPNLGMNHVKAGSVDVPADLLLDMLEDSILQLIGNNDQPNICGDMQNAFGESDRFIIPTIDESAIAVPTVDEEMLEMFMNARVCVATMGWFGSYDGDAQKLLSTKEERMQGYMFQDVNTNAIGTGTHFKINSFTKAFCFADGADTLLNMHSDPNPAKTMLLSRYANYVSLIMPIIGGGTGDECAWVQTASSLVTGIKFYRFDANKTLQQYNISSTMQHTTYNYIYAAITNPFHYCPTITIIDASTSEVLEVIQRSDIVGILPKWQQVEMNRIDLMTLVGAYNKF